VYPYRDDSGEIIAAVYRFDQSNRFDRSEQSDRSDWSDRFKTGQTGLKGHLEPRIIAVNSGNPGIKGGIPGKTGQKEIRPYCLILGAWVRPVQPVLYDLDAIAADQSRPIILVEGEKCADALAKLGLLVTTSMGGSSGARFADWTPIKGREVIIWPDNDTPGQKYADAAAEQCMQAGAARVAILSIGQNTLEQALCDGTRRHMPSHSDTKRQESPLSTSPDRSGPVRGEHSPPVQTDINDLPQGWDAADAISEGWQLEHIMALLEGAEPYSGRVVTAGANDNWPEPDRSILVADWSPPVFPLGILPEQIADLLVKTARCKSAPVDYVAASLLTGAASLIGSSRRVSPWQGWSEPAILWSALVGNPSAGKSPAMDPVLSVLSSIEGDGVEDHGEAMRHYETDKMEAALVLQKWESEAKDAHAKGYAPPLMPETAVAPDMPVRKRLTVRDATTEALLVALKGQDKGLLTVRDELAGWFAGMDRYAGSKGGDRALWLEAYGGRPYTLDRVKNGGDPFHIPSLAISVIGGIQPDRLENCLLKGDDDGLSARFLYFYPEPAPRQRPEHAPDARLLERMIRRLDGLTADRDESGRPTPRILPLSSGAIELFHGWWQALPGREQKNNRMNGWWGKAQGTALRLALILEYLNWVASADTMEPMEVTTITMEKAIHFMDAYAGPMAAHAHGETDEHTVDANTLMLARYIQEQGLTAFNVRDLQRSGPMRSLKAQEVKELCFNLVGHGWLQAAPIRQGDTPGKSQGRFLVNPAL
jgi:hypothetical protein